MLQVPVKVRAMPLFWIFKDAKSFLDLSKLLADKMSAFYSTNFVTYILDSFWDRVQWRLVTWYFIPHLVYMLSSVTFLSIALRDRSLTDQSTGEAVTLGITGVITFILCAYITFSEVQQLRYIDSIYDYLTSWWNYVDIVNLLVSPVIMILAWTASEQSQLENLRVAAAFTTCSLMIKTFDWLKLFQETAFFIMLVGETLNDVKSFFVILLSTLLMFGLPMFMLNLNRTAGDDGSEVITPFFGFWPLDVLMNQYFLALGEFNYDNFSNGSG